MDWHQKIFRYCERGSDPAFWAEPLNAVTNGAFILAAILAALHLARSGGTSRRISEWVLVLLMLAIGIGSFMFHTYATRWAAYADTGPIGLFMLAYFAYALRRFLGLNWILVAAGLAAFVAALQYAGGVECRVALLSAVAAARGPCLNGTAGYVPAFLAMLAIAGALAVLHHPAWRYLAAASIVFLASMTFRTLDWEICDLTRFAGHPTGTHFLWHVLNATTLYLLAIAAIRHGRKPG